MHYVTVPAPVQLRTIDKKPYREQDPDSPNDPTKTVELKPVTMHRYLMLYIVNEAHPPGEKGQPGDLKIGKGYEGNKRTSKLDRAFEAAQPGDIIAVEDEDWRKVKAIIEERYWPMPSVGAQLIDMEDAWVSASEKKPEASNGLKPLVADLDKTTEVRA